MDVMEQDDMNFETNKHSIQSSGSPYSSTCQSPERSPPSQKGCFNTAPDSRGHLHHQDLAGITVSVPDDPPCNLNLKPNPHGLYCIVCGDVSSGKHYGILACNGCSGFFKRSVRRKLIYRCQAGTGMCVIDKAHRNQCQACRLKKCLHRGMNKDAVQNERQPRNSSQIRNNANSLDSVDLSDMISGNLPSHSTSLSTTISGNTSGTHSKSSLPSAQPGLSQVTISATHPSFSTIFPHSPPTLGPLGPHLPPPGPRFFPPPPPFLLHQFGLPLASQFTQRVEEYCKELSLRSESEQKWPGATSVNLNNNNSCSTPVSLSHHSNTRPSHEDSHTPRPEDLTPNKTTTNPLDQPSSANLPVPSLMNITNSLNSPSDALYECSARLLFMAVRWARSLPSFTSLPFRDQIILLEETWAELFLLSMLQWSIPLENPPFLPASDSPLATKETNALLDLLQKMKFLQIDPAELSCIKAIALFKPDAKGLKDPLQVETLQDQAQMMLAQHIRMQYPTQPARFGKFLLLLPSIRVAPTDTLQRAFFGRTLGSMERLLSDMFKS